MFCFYILGALTAAALFSPAMAQAQNENQQDAAVIVAAVEAFIRAQANHGAAQLKIEIQPPKVARLSACTKLVPYFSQGQKLRSRMSVGVRCLAPQPWIIFVPAALSVNGQYYVARQTIQPGRLITPELLTRREGDLLALPQDVALDPAQAVGYIAAQRIPAATPIKASSLRDPGSVQRGQKLKTMAHGDGFVVTGSARALESGAPGSKIQVRTEAGLVVSALVLDANTVQVIP